jgi:nucleoside-triphosphatase THEP1
MILRIVTGPVNSGKSTSLRRMMKRAVESGLSVGGFLTIPEWEEKGRRKKGFFLEFPGDFSPSEASIFSASPACGAEYDNEAFRVRIAGQEPAEGCIRVGRFFLYPEGIRTGFDAVKRSLQEDITIIDELGPAELEGKGHREALELALKRKEGELWISLRIQLLEEFLSFLRTLPFSQTLSPPPELFISQPFIPTPHNTGISPRPAARES